jgi:hypothetical protein
MFLKSEICFYIRFGAQTRTGCGSNHRVHALQAKDLSSNPCTTKIKKTKEKGKKGKEGEKERCGTLSSFKIVFWLRKQ